MNTDQPGRFRHSWSQADVRRTLSRPGRHTTWKDAP
jgi:hypothetical protein